MPVRKPLKLEIIDLALPDGMGVGKVNGSVVFVPGGIPGDILSVRVMKWQKRFFVGIIEDVISESPFRVKPLCPHSDRCGGCAFQHLSYEKQLEIKKNHLFQTLKRVGGLGLEGIKISGIIPSPDIFYYRNNLELSFGINESRGEPPIIGMKERVTPINRYTRTVTLLTRCMIFGEILERLLPLFEEFFRINRFDAYDPRRNTGLLRHLTVRESKTKKDAMLILETKEHLSFDFRILKERIYSVAPEVTSIYWIVNKRPGDYLHIDEKHLIFGKPFIEEVISGFDFRIYPGTFFQPNTKAAGMLYGEIARVGEIDEKDHVLGLYCGTGTIEISIARMCSDVVGVDAERANIETAKENAVFNGISNAWFYHARVEDFIKKTKRDRIDLLIVDPPRGGISKKGLESIFSIGPERFLYVSCNPATLARDLKVLTERRYEILRIVPFDFFPHTSHIETLCYLRRK